jgi:hypothetical protein
VCFHVAVFPLASVGCTGRLTGVAFMKFVYGAHLDDSLIVLGASVFFILVPYFGAPEKFPLEVSISVVILYVLLSLWLWFWLLWWLWLFGFGCMAVVAWSWLHGCGCLAGSCMLLF